MADVERVVAAQRRALEAGDRAEAERLGQLARLALAQRPQGSGASSRSSSSSTVAPARAAAPPSGEPIVVPLPDGRTVTFPPGTYPETIQAALRAFYTPAGSQAPQAPSAAPPRAPQGLLGPPVLRVDTSRLPPSLAPSEPSTVGLPLPPSPRAAGGGGAALIPPRPRAEMTRGAAPLSNGQLFAEPRVIPAQAPAGSSSGTPAPSAAMQRLLDEQARRRAAP